MPRFRVELLRKVVDIEDARVEVDAADPDEARRLALRMYEDDEDGAIEWEAYDRVDVSDAETGSVVELLRWRDLMP